MKKDLVSLLKQELCLLDQAESVLRHSYNSCKKIGIKKIYSKSELEKFEALTSRFARTSDIFIQKVLRTIDEIDRELPGTPRDRINRAEKKGIIDNAEILMEIRDLRNEIAHEYVPDAIHSVFKKVLKLSPKLFSYIKRVKRYSKKFFYPDAECPP
jgi:uncharacterized protein YutE (UPF0331/DUF86 family)